MNAAPEAMLEVLLVEDNPGDVLLTRKAFDRAEIPSRLAVVGDGEAAIDYLERSLDGEEVIPHLILLDINLPKVTGHEVLRHTKGRERLRRIPVVMLSGSDAEHDIKTSYDNHANSFITKPSNLKDLVSATSKLAHYWHALARKPPMGI